jgi:hypothetical protein
MAPDDSEPTGEYIPSSEANTTGSFLTDPTDGSSVMTEGVGVKANLNDMTAYSSDLNQIQMNFGHMGNDLIRPMESLIEGAFGGTDNMLEWTRFMNQLSRHNVNQLSTYFRNTALGVMNVAMAAQVVANVYAATDTTNAANLNAILFAFGDKSQAPSTIPKDFLKELKTFEELQAQNPAPAGEYLEGDPESNTTVTQDGNKTIVTVTLPDGRTMQTVTTPWSTYPGGPSGENKTVTINGKQVTSTSITTVNSVTTATTTTSYYDDKGKRTDQVTGRTRTTVEAVGTDIRTSTESTSYTYDAAGQKKLDESTTQSQVQVGMERPTEEMMTVDDDPAQKKKMEIAPPPEPDPDDIILAPGPLDGQQHGGNTSGGVVA